MICGEVWRTHPLFAVTQIGTTFFYEFAILQLHILQGVAQHLGDRRIEDRDGSRNNLQFCNVRRTDGTCLKWRVLENEHPWVEIGCS